MISQISMYIKNVCSHRTLLGAIFLTFSLPGCFSWSPQMESLNCSELLFKNNKPTQALQSLLTLTGISDFQPNLESIVDVTQKNWLRHPDQERWHMQEKFADKRDEFLGLFDELHILQEIKPTQKKYTYVLFMGAALYRTRTRLAYLIHLYNQGIRFDEVVILTGSRPLDPVIEPEYDLLNPDIPGITLRADWQAPTQLPTTESDMIRFVFDQTDVPFDRDIITVIDTPMQTKADGTRARPTTGDTIRTWLAQNPAVGSCLAVSNQPYVCYQDTVLRTYLLSEFNLEAAGEAITESERKDLKIAVTLDAIARWLYQMKVRKTASTNLT